MKNGSFEQNVTFTFLTFHRNSWGLNKIQLLYSQQTFVNLSELILEGVHLRVATCIVTLNGLGILYIVDSHFMICL